MTAPRVDAKYVRCTCGAPLCLTHFLELHLGGVRVLRVTVDGELTPERRVELATQATCLLLQTMPPERQA